MEFEVDGYLRYFHYGFSQLTLTVPFVFLVLLYTITIHICFGHETYWRLRVHIPTDPGPLHDFIERGASLCKKVLNRYEECRVSPSLSSTLNSEVAREERKIMMFEQRIESNLQGVIAEYMNGYELLQLSQTSRNFHRLLMDANIWDSLASRCVDMKADCVHWLASRRIDLSKLSMKEQFFHLVKLYPYYLVERLSLPPCKEEEASRGAEIVEQKKEVVVIINDAVYSLSHQFVEAHPGGDSILKHYHCKNASKMFELACHSRSARNQATGFAVWSADLWVGRKGYLMILDPSVFPRREGSMSRPRSWTSELSAEFSKYEEDVMR